MSSFTYCVDDSAFCESNVSLRSKTIITRFMSLTLSLIAAIIILPLLCTDAAALSNPPGNGARSTILYEANTGTVLFTENADEQLPIASITKIMTAIVALENCEIDSFIQMDWRWTEIEGSSSGFEAGEWYTARQFLYALMLESGNDAAAALACHTAGSIEAFAELMNEKARELGMTNSSFKNPHGLDEYGHYSSARDMAVLMAYAMENKDFALIASTREAKVGDITLYNHNKLLSMYPGVIGGKTGYTSLSGRTLVSCASLNGMLLVCVTLDDGDDWDDHMALYDWASDGLRLETALSPDKPCARLPVISGDGSIVQVRPVRAASFLIGSSDTFEVKLMLPSFVYAEVSSGGPAGEAKIMVNGLEADSVPLIFAHSVGIDSSVPLSVWEKIKWSWYRANEYSRYGQIFIYG